LGALRQGVEEFAEGYKPLFAVITTTKRHSKRFFALTPQGKLVNPPPGMVVDHTITLPNVNEYFMQSHYPIQVRGFIAISFRFKSNYRIPP
jgi:hypothetical protein